jgi:hypothetical protein
MSIEWPTKITLWILSLYHLCWEYWGSISSVATNIFFRSQLASKVLFIKIWRVIDSYTLRIGFIF